MATATENTPPQAPPLFNHTPESITSSTEELIARAKGIIDKVVAETTIENATFENTLKPILLEDNITDPIGGVTCFYHYVSTDAALREASLKAEEKMSELAVDLRMREDIFQRVNTVYQNREAAGLDPEALHIVEREHKRYLNAGLLLPAGPNRDRFKEIQLELSRLTIEARNNANSETGGIFFTAEELAGVPESAVNISELEKGTGENEGKFKVGFKPNISVPLMEHATRPETRRDYYISKENKLNINTSLFKRILLLRDEAARLVGYNDHASLRISEKMALTSDNVNTFLADMQVRAGVGLKNDVAKLLVHKKAEHETRGLEYDDELYIWDVSYYERIQKEKEYSVDEQAISEFFALWPTFNGMLAIFQKLLGLRFEELDAAARARLSPTGRAEDVVWHEDVNLYSVWDEADASFMGYLYLDMHPRDHKYSHYANFGIGPGSSDNADGRHHPFTALVCNFPKPTKEKPALLQHGDVVTLFHELGHGIHNLVSKTQYSATHGTHVSRDFVEAPSQMLEHWCWVPRVLKELSSRWDTKAPIGDELVANLIRTKNVNSSLFNLRQLVYSTYDMLIHGPASHEALEALDLAKVWNERRAEVSGIKGPESTGYGPHWSEGYNNIGHYIGGYDAGYYGYMYSEVFSADMYYTAFKADPLNSEQGHRYRRIVLERGGSRPEMDLLKEFLGREPNSDAFFQDLGLA
ncbi:metallopeptidase MepB [Cordyceps fumosorosea ARSEF 2679]|uniref:Metallopeptidase MepB n=1 Tax=Cordyceps fumosorosea (strain ARSEF 2679) TaxID=1081104 RepID=A0A162KCE8_CORFA|nr:metallopeptidase MepB [Cordyceps fumosorosea ARSEF 2679]OAA66028.1 metallopeptidase MepB [Cordyceps fumosorosea ARSEF 2679]